MFFKSAHTLVTPGEKFTGIQKKWVPSHQISKHMYRSVLKAEDHNFFLHNGFDFDAIKKAMHYNKTHKKKIGASTITQQTAKNVFLWPNRSWARKALEVYFTILIEFFWSKERILEVYLNVIEFGKGIYGVEAASKIYFNKSAKDLTQYESALLAAVLPNPVRYKVSAPSSFVKRRQNKILRSKISTLAFQEIQTFYKRDDLKESVVWKNHKKAYSRTNPNQISSLEHSNQAKRSAENESDLIDVSTPGKESEQKNENDFLDLKFNQDSDQDQVQDQDQAQDSNPKS